MSAAALALRVAVYQHVVADAVLTGLLGGPKVYDEPPRASAPPYVAIGDVGSADLSGDLAPVEEHALTLEVVSREGGLSEALKVADRLARLVDGAPLTLSGFRLAILAWTSSEAARAADGGLRRAKVTFRAVTEPLGG